MSKIINDPTDVVLFLACGNIFHAIWQKVSLDKLEVVLEKQSGIHHWLLCLALISS